MTVVFDVAGDRKRPARRVRPWFAHDMPRLLAATGQEDPADGLKSRPGLAASEILRWTGPRNTKGSAVWLAAQERGWARGDRLTFAVLDVPRNNVVRHVELKNRDGGQVACPYWFRDGHIHQAKATL